MAMNRPTTGRRCHGTWSQTAVRMPKFVADSWGLWLWWKRCRRGVGNRRSKPGVRRSALECCSQPFTTIHACTATKISTEAQGTESRDTEAVIRGDQVAGRRSPPVVAASGAPCGLPRGHERCASSGAASTEEGPE